LPPRVLNRIELVENDDGTVRVIAYDNEGIEITDLCDVDWIGDVEEISDDTVKGKGEITVRVTFKGKTLEETVEVKDNSSSGSFNYLLILIPAVIVVILIIIAYLFTRPRRDYSEEE
jgi:hypothetical protein